MTAMNSGQHAKTLTAAQEIAARGGPVYLLSDESDVGSLTLAGSVLLPEANPLLTPFVQAIAAQMISYHAALALGRDIDQPRNLAKAVTV